MWLSIHTIVVPLIILFVKVLRCLRNTFPVLLMRDWYIPEHVAEQAASHLTVRLSIGPRCDL